MRAAHRGDLRANDGGMNTHLDRLSELLCFLERVGVVAAFHRRLLAGGAGVPVLGIEQLGRLAVSINDPDIVPARVHARGLAVVRSLRRAQRAVAAGHAPIGVDQEVAKLRRVSLAACSRLRRRERGEALADLPRPEQHVAVCRSGAANRGGACTLVLDGRDALLPTRARSSCPVLDEFAPTTRGGVPYHLLDQAVPSLRDSAGCEAGHSDGRRADVAFRIAALLQRLRPLVLGGHAPRHVRGDPGVVAGRLASLLLRRLERLLVGVVLTADVDAERVLEGHTRSGFVDLDEQAPKGRGPAHAVADHVLRPLQPDATGCGALVRLHRLQVGVHVAAEVGEVAGVHPPTHNGSRPASAAAML